MVCLSNVLALTALAMTGMVSAHPGAQHHVQTAAQLSQRRLFMSDGKRALAACANNDNARVLKEQAIARRAAKVQELRNERQRRLDASTVLNTDHESSLTGVTVDTEASELFGDDVACVLEPEVTQGPYYVSGEYIRNAIAETQEGVTLYTDVQFVDVNTCEPVEDLYVDFWHCNATGVYSGIVASGNGDSTDETNLDNTFLRGLAPTDSEGVVQFTTIFPGHYTSRATHIHVVGSSNGTVLDNNTYSGGVASHVGQLFFDQSLITEVEATSPYSTNTQELTTNAADTIFAEEVASDFDPVFEYVLLGDSISDGVFAWISVGVDMTVSETLTGAATLTADGGVQAETSTTGGGGGGGSGFGGSGFGGSGMGSGFVGSGSGFPGSAGGSFGSVEREASAASEESDATTTTTTSSTSKCNTRA